MAKKGSFFERLTGSNYYDEEEAEEVHISGKLGKGKAINSSSTSELSQSSNDDGEGQLTVDVYQMPDEIIIEAMIPGVKVDDLDIAITREMVTIRGNRERHREVEDDQYFFRELFWGAFSRTILLPQEIEPEQADAKEKNGVLTINLPKGNKDKQHKVKVKSSQS